MMAEWEVTDYSAVYAAALSTILAISKGLSWLLKGPRLHVEVFTPEQTSFYGRRCFLAIISNSGTQPVVIKEVVVSLRTSRWHFGQEVHRAVFNERSTWKPSLKSLPIDGRPNHFKPVPNVIYPNEELRAPAKVASAYVPSEHWIKVIAKPRNSRRTFVGWGAPERDTP
jgi:hypothetical protein